MEDRTLLELIIIILKENNIDAYPPATHKGECKAPYVVVKNSGSSQIGNFSSQYDYYDILCYVPQNEYTSLFRYKKSVKEIIEKNLFPRLMPAGQETADYFDDAVKGHMSSVLYRNSVRNKLL